MIPNVVVSGFLWQGLPRQILDAARVDILELFTSDDLLAELRRVLRRPKFASRIALAGFTPETIETQFLELATPLTTGAVEVRLRDPDDAAVLACALAANADFVVSGDRDLLDLGSFEGIPIVRVRDFLTRLNAERPGNPSRPSTSH